MRIKKLVLHGFKSFADKTEFEFREGITAIVGPNGCGKSNVVDAVKWVLGEQRPSSLRGKEMQDVIFSGTGQRKAVGYAEVSLVFDNTSRTLPVDYTEVEVTRRLYRSGESEYLLNGNRVRLRDVRELLMDSGGGPGSVSVMEQGNIDRLLRADPQERRAVFEEAAGISKYRSRRKETERKLERTAENLARLRDILAENETRQRSLKIQAGKARRWQEFTEELKRKRVAGALARYAELKRRRDAAQGELDEVERLEGAARAELDAAMSGADERRQELDALRERVSAGEARLATLLGERRAAEEKEAARVREAGELVERAEAADQERSDAERRRADLGREAEEVSARGAEASAERAVRAEAQAAAEALAAEAEARVELLRVERDDLDLKRTEAYAAETEARNEEVSCEAELRALGQRLARLHDRVTTSGAELSSLEAHLKDLSLALKRSEEGLRALEDRAAAAEEGVREARRAADEASAESGRLGGETAALEARRDLLRGLVAEGEGLAAGAKALLGSGLAGVRGTVADLIGDAGPEAAALDQALGDLAGAVVFETTDQALAAVDWLREGARGRARVVPLDRLGQGALPERFAGLPEEAARVAGALLAGTRLVATREEALAAPGGRIIVLCGEEYEAAGAIVGGTGDAGAGLVRRNAELAEMELKVRESELARAAAAARLEEARGRGRSWEAAIEELRPRLKDARAEVRAASEALAAATKAATSRAEEIDLEKAERSDVEAMVAELEARRGKARVELGRASAEREALEAGAGDLKERLVRATKERDAAHGRRMEANVELARWSEKADAFAQRAQAVADAIAAAEREARARAEEAESCRTRRAACLDEIESLQRLAVEREKTSARLAADVEGLRGEVRELQEGLQRGDARTRELRQAHEARRQELERHRLREQEIRLRMETLFEEVRRDHGLALDSVELDEETAQADPEALEREIEDLRSRLERLGSVNHSALDDLREVEEKLAFLQREEADLVTADRQLRETITKIDEICTTRFTETFERVREHFQVTFRKLFGGGKAEIVLENPEDVLGSGIEVRVRPPGKELRNMALLSGGERSLTTVALLFSIYQIKPPPFCLLDEVDAALDEANTARMCEMLRDFSQRGQFLVITHARPTMTVADTLYGVTMPEAGVSRHVAVRFADIEAGRVVGLN